MNFLIFLISLVVLLNFVVAVESTEIDNHGYVTFCPCMGRFGNQADQYLGALAFAKGLNRTLLLPAWVEYKRGHAKSVQVPFSTYFSVAGVREYVKAMALETFMADLALTVWPPEKRYSLCYMGRQAVSSPGDGGCNAKDGNPFGSFWDTYGVDFSDSRYYSPLSYDATTPNFKKHWDLRFPAQEFPVLAFTGAPGAFPVTSGNVELQRHLVWSTSINSSAEKFVATAFSGEPFVGIHLRNGVDWDNSCQHAQESTHHFFASPQCLGYNFEHGNLYPDLCSPPQKIILKQVKKALNRLKTKNVFVATDNDAMLEVFQKHIKKVKAVTLPDPEPHLDLAVLGRASHYIGNCLSTFSAFAKRERDVKGLSSEFWAFPPSVLGRRGGEL